MYFLFILISFCLWQISFGSEYRDATLFALGNSEFTSSAFREMLRDPFIEVKTLLSEDSVYIESILSDINSTVTYDHETHFRNIFENFTDEEKLLKLSNFFFKLCGYFELSLFEQFRKENHPNPRLSDIKKFSESGSRNFEWALAALQVINFALLKQRLVPGDLIMKMILELTRNLEKEPSVDRVIEFTRLILSCVMAERGKGELSKSEKYAFRSLLSLQKNLMKQSLDCVQKVFNPERKELVGCPFVSLPHKIDEIIASYQLDEPKPPIHPDSFN